MNTYTSNDSLFSNINKKGGISLISKINQNSGGNFKLVDIVDIDWDGSTVYTYNDNGDTTKNIINDSAQFLSIFQNTINRVESNNFNKYVQTIDNVKDYYDPETKTWTTGYTDGLVTATDVTKHIIDNEYVVSTHLNNFSTELTNTYNSLYTELNNQTDILNEKIDNIIEQNKDNICTNLEQTKASLYYNCNDYMKVDYRGTTYYSTNDNKYIYSDNWTIQHMYLDDELTTFIPGLPYQDPFKAIVTFKMPLMFSGGWSHQQLIMCQDFIWGDGQDDHAVMCPKWYTFGGMQWGGSVLNYNVVKYTTGYPALYTNENIDISFNVSSTTKTDYFLTVFIYPLIRIKDVEGHVYSPVLVSAMDNTKTAINKKYTWMESTNPVSILERSITNPNYKENIASFYTEHIKQINKTFFGNDGITLPTSANDLKSTRFQSFKGSNASNEGKLVSLDSVLKQHINNSDTIELLTIDNDGYTISCGKSNNYTDLLTNYNSYKEFISDKINNSIKNKYPWLF